MRDKRIGESLQAPAGINAWPAVANGMILWPCGLGEKPGLIALSI